MDDRKYGMEHRCAENRSTTRHALAPTSIFLMSTLNVSAFCHPLGVQHASKVKKNLHVWWSLIYLPMALRQLSLSEPQVRRLPP